MFAGRGARPVIWGKLALTPHRENPPRTQCRDCAGGGEINGVSCRSCRGRGWHAASQQAAQRQQEEPEQDMW
jgi:hypothetical protein